MTPNRYNIDKDIHYFALMEPIETFLGIISFTSSTNALSWFECEVDESRYKVDENYKITLRAINGKAYEHFYQVDFMSLLKSGYIIPKTSENMRVKEVYFREYIPGTIAYIEHTGTALVTDED